MSLKALTKCFFANNYKLNFSSFKSRILEHEAIKSLTLSSILAKSLKLLNYADKVNPCVKVPIHFTTLGQI